MRASRLMPLVLLTVIAAESVVAQAPPKTRQDIVRRGATAIGSPYVWGGGNWDPNDRGFGGADCSGFVSKCWSIPQWTPTRVNLHGPSTYHYIQTPGSDWYEVDRADMLYGDAIVYRYNNNQSGHTYLYLAGDGWGEHEVYEARGTAYGIVHRWRTAYSDADVTKGIRCANLIENVGVTEHIVEADDGAPAYVDVGMTGDSTADSYAPGCTEGACRYHLVTAQRNESCTFRPTLPEAGWYRIYVTCNEASPNVHDVGVTVLHAGRDTRYLWDQADPATLNRWHNIGDTSFYFEAGSSGAVVWDDYDAWPTTGDHVFRGDATKFVLDNRVVVDGVGGAPGTFASINAAVVWLRARASEEPDVINITCDTLVEPACIELDMLDDVTIEGDADGNGVPATIVVNPSTPDDFAEPCGLYLDVPIGHHYTLRDLTLIPAFVAAGHVTGAYGLVCDEQNPTGEASGIRITLDNVTVAGSLAGNVPTHPDSDTRDAATMFGGVGVEADGALLQRGAEWAGDEACRQTVTATNLTITHSATAGVVLTSAYTAWEIPGGLRLTCNNGVGLRSFRAEQNTLRIDATAGAANRIAGNLAGGLLITGGAVSIDIANCEIAGNSGDSVGGLRIEETAAAVRNCLIAENTTSGGGAAVLIVDGNLTIDNCTLAHNTAAAGGGAIFNWSSDVWLANSIVWGNGPSPIAGDVSASYCAIEGGHAGVGNIDADPAFADPAQGDYHLRRVSPCINEADPHYLPQPGATDVDGQPRVQAAFLDMGADETAFWDGDADHDGDVDGTDFAALADCLAGPAQAPGAGATCLAALDYDDDGDIDLFDAAHFHLRAAAGLSVPDIVLEVRDAGGSLLPPPAYDEVGDWLNSTAKSTLPELVGTGSRFIMYDLPNSGSDHATFVPTIAVGGLYEVFVTWGTGANCFDAQYTVEHADGTTVLLVDQIPEGVTGANANTWVSLGQYRFVAGQNAGLGAVNVSEVTVSGKPHPGWNQRVYADAARWVYVGTP